MSQPPTLPSAAARLRSRAEVAELDLSLILKTRFNYPAFRVGQKRIIENVLAGRDTMAVMPTGGGKSLCYQLPAVVFGRPVIVVSPLIALMQDQVRSLKALGLRAGCLHSGQSRDEKIQIFRDLKAGGEYILFLSPERIQKPGFAEWVRNQDIALFAIDEAHCVSQWGPDFRPDYFRLNLLRQLRPDIPILALTASATREVIREVIQSLGLLAAERHVHGFYRPNLFYQAAFCEDEDDKLKVLKQALRVVPEGRVIIYCGTRQSAEEIASELEDSFDQVGFYHAGLDKEERTRVQQKLDRGELRILCATNAFGMGVDYPDVRLVAHSHLPASLEAFYQEAGRAGRDGKTARCLLLHSRRDKGLQSYFIQQSEADARVVSARWKALDSMIYFAESKACRNSTILDYFGDAERLRRCGHCDICAPSSPWFISPSRKIIRRR